MIRCPLWMTVPAVVVLLAANSFGDGGAPEISFDTLPGTGGARLKVLVFETTPGVVYRVRSSPDLITWDEGIEHYGLGSEFLVPVAEIQPPNDPPAGGVSNPGQFVSLIMQPAAAPSTGLVMSWASLDHGGPMVVGLDVTPDPGWEQNPLYSQAFGDHRFFIMRMTQTAEFPDPVTTMGPGDQAMWTAFETNFAAMDAEVAAGTGSSSNAPVTAPEPNEAGFWQIEADWTIDSDGDGTPDSVEMKIASDPGHLDYGLANAFNADQDEDGVFDGMSYNEDGDHAPDIEDASPSDDVVDWKKEPEPRYTVFDVAIPEAEEGMPPYQAIQTNDQGHVLFLRHIWAEGTLTPLILDSPTATGCIALGMNNEGEIIGLGMPTTPPEGSGGSGEGGGAGSSGPGVVVLGPRLVHWSSRTDPPVLVENAAGQRAVPVWEFLDSPEQDPLFAADGLIDDASRFVGRTLSEDPYVAIWQKTQNGFAEAAAPHEALRYVLAPNYAWGHDPEGSGDTLLYQGAAAWESLPGLGLRLSHRPAPVPAPGQPQEPDENFVAAFFRDNEPIFPFSDNPWRRPVLGIDKGQIVKARDLSLNGVAAMEDGTIWVAGNPTADRLGVRKPFGHVAHGLGVYVDLPGLVDASPKGCLMGVHRVSEVGSGELQSTSAISAIPWVLRDDVFATGVDDATPTASVDPTPASPDEPGGDDEPDRRYWVMAPAGGSDPNSLFLETPAEANELELTVTQSAGVTPQTFTIEGPAHPVDLAATLEESADLDSVIKLGDMASRSLPFGVKAMKRRTVKAKLWPIALTGGSGSGVASIVPDTEPEREAFEAEIESKLNDVFGRQVNAWWDVEVQETTTVDWDLWQATDPDGTPLPPALDVFDEVLTGEQSLILQSAGYDEETVSINIYLVDGSGPLNLWGWTNDAWIPSGKTAYGFTDINRRAVWLQGEAFGNEIPEKRKEQLLHTLAHEVGHVMIGSGHPNQGEGAAPLKGSATHKRLMHAATVFYPPGQRELLVKKEWDKIEGWLQTEEFFERILP